MRLLLCHNHYQQAGGEDRVFADEAQLLASRGHDVRTYTRHNDDVNGMGKLGLAANTIWSRQSAKEIGRLVREHRAEVVHFHNTLPLISPAAYYAARRAGAAVVQTLHNYRFVCPKATFFRDGKPCEDCLGKFVPLPAIQHACYRDNRSASAAIAAMLVTHRTLGTYRRAVDAYIALSQFLRDKLVVAGLPAEKMHLRPNYMPSDPGAGPGGGGYAFYLGRLSPEKGVNTLLEAWLKHDPGIPLVICGSGPLGPIVEQAVAQGKNIEWYPGRGDEEVLERLGRASVFVLPSTNYEGFPKTIVEAYAKGTPVVASRLGAMAELIREGSTGACFIAGDAADLAAAIRRTTTDSTRLAQMRTAARRSFETNYTADVTYERLLEIYDHALRVRHGAVATARNHSAGENQPAAVVRPIHTNHPTHEDVEVCA